MNSIFNRITDLFWVLFCSKCKQKSFCLLRGITTHQNGHQCVVYDVKGRHLTRLFSQYEEYGVRELNEFCYEEQPSEQ